MTARDLGIFDAILSNIAAQPELLERLEGKQKPRRFTGEPITGFGGLSTERRQEISAEERDCERADERRERDEAGE